MAEEKDDIERYRDGTLDNAKRHALEKKALSDRFLADALAGAESVSPGEFSADLRELSERIEKSQAVTWFTPLRIAASVVALIGASALFYFLTLTEPPMIAQEQSIGTGPGASDTVLSLSKDVDSSLLTLARPDETEPKPAVTQAGPLDMSKDQDQLSELRQSSGVSTQTKPAELGFTQAEEEKSKIAAVEIQDDKKAMDADLQPVSAGGAGDQNKKESLTKRQIRADDTSAEKNNQTIAGKVTSGEDGLPLPGVTVTVKGTQQGTVTDVGGNYYLAVTGENIQLVFSFVGMHPVEVVTNDKSKLDVEMREDVSELGEIVVTEKAIDTKTDLREPIIKMAAPVGGIRSYNKYLDDNLRYPTQALENKVKGRVTVQFTVTTEGALTEFNVVKGIGYGCDEEVIRLVKEGPRWAPTTQDDVAVESEVKVRMKFDPDKAKK